MLNIASFLNPLDQGLMGMVVEDEQKRIWHMRQQWDAYYGRLAKPLRATESDPRGEDNIIIPYGRLIVDTVVSWLYGLEPDFELDPDDDTPEEAWLDEVWSRNRKMLTLQKHGKNSAICGHAYLKILPTSQLTSGMPRLVVLDPETVRVIYDESDIDVVTGYEIIQTVADAGNGKPGVKRQRIDRVNPNAWTIVDEIAQTGTSGWRHVLTTAWPYPFAPVVDAQHILQPNVYYGLSEIDEATLELNRAINLGYSSNNRVGRIHGSPITWAKGVGGKDLRVGPDAVIVLGQDGELHNLEMTGDMSAVSNHLDRLTEAMLHVKRIPLLAIGEVKGIGQTPGVTLLLMFRPLMQKIEELRLTQEHLLNDLNARLLVIGGKATDYESLSPRVTWPDVLPKDPLQEAQTAQILEQLGVSQATLLTQLGYDAEDEAAKRAEQAPSVGSQLLQAFDSGKGAVQQLGAGQGVDAVTNTPAG